MFQPPNFNTLGLVYVYCEETFLLRKAMGRWYALGCFMQSYCRALALCLQLGSVLDQEDAGLRAADATRRQQGAGTQGLNWAGTWGGEGERFV